MRYADDAQVDAVFDRIRGEQGRLDLLVNNAWSGYEISPDPSLAFRRHWDLMLTGGLRAAAYASGLAAPMIIAAGRGLIVSMTRVLDRPPRSCVLRGGQERDQQADRADGR